MSTLDDRVRALLAGPRPLPLVHAGDPVLRRPAAEYRGELPPELLAELIDALHVTMTAAPGVGLAAPQVGLGVRIAVVEDRALLPAEIARARDRRPTPFRVLINPVYAAVGPEVSSAYEGCLSVPGYQAVVDRARVVRLSCWSESGGRTEEDVSGWAARIVAHETDHLDGTLYLDRARLRSLTTVENYLARWSGPALEPARNELGF